MKKILTLTLTFIVSLALFVWSVDANAQSEEQIKKFNEDREAYFNENLELTDSEKEAFWPVYEDFINRKMRLTEEERNTFKYSNDNAGNLSDKEINEILARILDYKSQVFKLEQEYYKDKFPAVLPPEKVLKLYKVEWDFRRHLVRKLRGDGKGSGRGDGHGKNPGQPAQLPVTGK